jgi:hypothetical protein
LRSSVNHLHIVDNTTFKNETHIYIYKLFGFPTSIYPQSL